MSGVSYDVTARLRLKGAQQAKSHLQGIAGKLRDVSNFFGRAQGAAGGLLGKILALGAAYAGLRVGIQMFQGLASSAVKYTADLEKTKIGLTSVLSAVEGIGWSKAGDMAEKQFQRLREASITSPATPQEMINIFSGIVGPLRSAGTEMDRIREITKATVLASGALGVDYAQAQRDINMMARGTAGADVKLFSMLRATGAIAEDAKTFNTQLSQAERVSKIEAALSKFAGSGDAFGKSWAGVTSTFKGIVDELKRAAVAPVLKAVGRQLGGFNSLLIKNNELITKTLTGLGERAGAAVEAAGERIRRVYGWIVANWPTITATSARVWRGMKTAASAIASAVERMAKYLPAIVDAGKRAATFVMANREQIGAGLKRAAVVSTGVALARPAIAGAAGAGASIASAAGGVAGTGVMASLATAAPAIALVAAAAGALVVVLGAVYDHWQSFSKILSATVGPLVGEIGLLLYETWTAVFPLLKLVGSLILLVVVPAFIATVSALRVIVRALIVFMRWLGGVTKMIYTTLRPAFAAAFSMFANFATHTGKVVVAFGDMVAGILSWVGIMRRDVERELKITRAARSAAQDPNYIDPSVRLQAFGDAGLNKFGTLDSYKPLARRAEASATRMRLPTARGGAAKIDARNARITIKQEFRDQTDPDRLIAFTLDDILSQAEQRVTSGLVGALTR